MFSCLPASPSLLPPLPPRPVSLATTATGLFSGGSLSKIVALAWCRRYSNLHVCKKLLRNRLQKQSLASYYYICILFLHLPQVVIPAISLGLELNGRARQLFSMTIVLAIFAFSLCMMFFPKVCVVFRTSHADGILATGAGGAQLQAPSTVLIIQLAVHSISLFTRI